MRILLVHEAVLPVTFYGGTERVVWYLGRELVRMGHDVTFLLNPGSTCDFAPVRHLQPGVPLAAQIPTDFDVAHVHWPLDDPAELPIPFVATMHGNISDPSKVLHRNTIFVSADHAARFGATHFVHNGMDWSDYGPVDFSRRRDYFHFLGKAAWRVKNVQGAIDVVTGMSGGRLVVMGGSRLNFNMGFRFTLSPRVRFAGMVGGAQKLALLNGSRGLVFPVKWHEPFGLAITESLYFGCPVFGTPYGSLRELVPGDVGHLATSRAELTAAAARWNEYDPRRCHEHARDRFDSRTMAEAYLRRYAIVANGGSLHDAGPRLVDQQPRKHLDWA